MKKFIVEHIDSLSQLEILLLFQRNPGREFAPEDVATELRIDSSWAAPCLGQLLAAGMLTSSESPEPKFKYGPASQPLAKAIEELANIFLSHRVRIATLIFTKPPDALRGFADAFRIGGS